MRPAGPVETARKHLARDLVAEIRDADQRLKTLTAQIADTPSSRTAPDCREVDGIGSGHRRAAAGSHPPCEPVRHRRPRSPATPASHPIEVASADRARHRLPRGGDRQLNLALHIIALTQVRMRGSTGRAYYDTKIAAGKTHNEAMRCLKRRLADHVWRLMIRDEHDQAAGPGGHSGATLHPARLAQPRPPALRTSHFPNPPTPTLRPPRPAA